MNQIVATCVTVAIMMISYLDFTASILDVTETLGFDVKMVNLVFKYHHRKYPGTAYLMNMTDENFYQDLQKVWVYNQDLKIVTHGWISSEASQAVVDIKNAYLETRDINVITLDWSYTASTKAYPITAVMTYQIGILAAEVLNKLVDVNFTSYDRMHMIGHSLGAHVSGSTGKHCKEKMSRITGLDPAGPGFHFMFSSEMRLDAKDANFVDIIHTSAGVAGYYEAIGHADFYPNSGKPPQPGCLELSINVLRSITSEFGCSHFRSYEFFSESIRNPEAFKSIRCDSWANFQNGDCGNASDIQYMGDPALPTAKGVYYLTTNAKRPYGQGETTNGSISKMNPSN